MTEKNLFCLCFEFSQKNWDRSAEIKVAPPALLPLVLQFVSKTKQKQWVSRKMARQAKKEKKSKNILSIFKTIKGMFEVNRYKSLRISFCFGSFDIFQDVYRQQSNGRRCSGSSPSLYLAQFRQNLWQNRMSLNESKKKFNDDEEKLVKMKDTRRSF